MKDQNILKKLKQSDNFIGNCQEKCSGVIKYIGYIDIKTKKHKIFAGCDKNKKHWIPMLKKPIDSEKGFLFKYKKKFFEKLKIQKKGVHKWINSKQKYKDFEAKEEEIKKKTITFFSFLESEKASRTIIEEFFFNDSTLKKINIEEFFWAKLNFYFDSYLNKIMKHKIVNIEEKDKPFQDYALIKNHEKIYFEKVSTKIHYTSHYDVFYLISKRIDDKINKFIKLNKKKFNLIVFDSCQYVDNLWWIPTFKIEKRWIKNVNIKFISCKNLINKLKQRYKNNKYINHLILITNRFNDYYKLNHCSNNFKEITFIFNTYKIK